MCIATSLNAETTQPVQQEINKWQDQEINSPHAQERFLTTAGHNTVNTCNIQLHDQNKLLYNLLYSEHETYL